MLKRALLTAFGLFFALLSIAQVTIVVDAIPSNTPANDPIHIAGDFQGWDPGSTAHILTEDTVLNIRHITLPANLGTINFKFTRGDWTKVEGDVNGSFIPDRSHTPANGDTLFLQILGWEDLGGGGGGGGQSTAAANVSILTDSFYMPQLNRYRRIWLYLPLDYNSTTHDYPVLYMHDGQNVFDDLTSFIGEWEVDETLNDLHAAGDPGIIVVAIDNGQNLRIDEYTPWYNATYGGGDGALYIDFIIDDLMPYINANYRTLTEPENTGIMGSSLGGLISTYAGIEHQDVFGKVGAFSPAYWINPEAFGHVTSTGKQEPMRIYQLGGTQEGANFITQMHAMHDTLAAAGFGPNELLTVEKSDGQHSEWFWAREFEAAYLWLFRDTLTSTPELLTGSSTFQLYPNPASDHINLQFSLEKASEVRVEIIDPLGRINRSIYADTLTEGGHQLNFSLKKLGLPAGAYACRLHIGKSSSALKFMVVD